MHLPHIFVRGELLSLRRDPDYSTTAASHAPLMLRCRAAGFLLKGGSEGSEG